LTFSLPVPHGERGERGGMVMMTRIEEGKEVFVHASDIQLLDEGAVSGILAWQPTIVLASGPPLILATAFTETTQNGVAQCGATCSRGQHFDP